MLRYREEKPRGINTLRAMKKYNNIVRNSIAEYRDQKKKTIPYVGVRQPCIIAKYVTSVI